MPVYEFLCPRCRKCGAEKLRRVPSRFGVAAASKTAKPGGGEGAEHEDPRLEREMMRFAAELEGMDEGDPRQMAAAVRRMTELAGEPITPAMEEMIRRLEAGEDPDRIEEELGDALAEEMGEEGGAFGEPAPTRDDGLYPM